VNSEVPAYDRHHFNNQQDGVRTRRSGFEDMVSSLSAWQRDFTPSKHQYRNAGRSHPNFLTDSNNVAMLLRVHYFGHFLLGLYGTNDRERGRLSHLHARQCLGLGLYEAVK